MHIIVSYFTIKYLKYIQTYTSFDPVLYIDKGTCWIHDNKKQTEKKKHVFVYFFSSMKQTTEMTKKHSCLFFFIEDK